MNRICIHGLGYVGLTAALHWARAGWEVWAFDTDHRVIDALRKGEPRAGEFLSYLNTSVADYMNAGLILPTHDLADCMRECSVHSIAIPTEKAGVPWDEGVIALVKTLIRNLHAGTILVESTLTPGTIDKALLGLPKQTRDDLLSTTATLRLAVCPRRDWFASPDKSLETLDRVVGGLTPAATERATELLSIVSKGPIHRCTYKEAEVVKALENAWLHALIMLPTELALNYSKDVDIATVTRLASTHWRLPDIFLGAGTGGRCVSLGTRYLLEASGPGGILEAINTCERHIRLHVAEAIVRRLGDQRPRAPVLILGVAYRPNFRDAGLSPALDVAKYLRNDWGVECRVADPMWTPEELRNLTGLPVHEAEEDYGAVFLATPHAEYSKPHKRAYHAKFVLDAQGTWTSSAASFAARGVEYKYVGGAGWR